MNNVEEPNCKIEGPMTNLAGDTRSLSTYKARVVTMTKTLNKGKLHRVKNYNKMVKYI